MAAVWRAASGGIDIAVRLTPKAAADRVDGVETASDGRPHLKARVRAVPEKGAANKALEKLVAAWLGVPASTVAVTAGATARLKTVRVSGNADALVAAIAARLGEAD
ncbi:MAG: DUF167 domain-containing protein [Rhizobiales bacterium]|nr:DUF167 domain-containing protein [Hyphomicrobiales bacterium]